MSLQPPFALFIIAKDIDISVCGGIHYRGISVKLMHTYTVYKRQLDAGLEREL